MPLRAHLHSTRLRGRGRCFGHSGIMWGSCPGLLRFPSDHNPDHGLHHGRCHSVLCGYRPHRFGDGIVFTLIRRILAEASRTAHPHIHDHRITVPGNSTGKRVCLQTPQTVEPVHHAAIRSSDMGTQTLRGDTVRVVHCLALILRPCHTGRECGDNRAAGSE